MEHGKSDVDSAKQLSGMQEAYERQEEEREDLEAELEKAHVDLQVGLTPIPFRFFVYRVSFHAIHILMSVI